MPLSDGYEVNQEIKSVLKIYPDRIRLYQYKVPFNIRRFDYDPYNPNRKKKERLKIEQTEELEKASLKRAKITVTDISLCNSFDLMTTFTFSKDRYNVDAKKRQMAFWLNNQRILHGKFKYVIVPEYHKDKALHFHALFSGYKGKLVDSGKKQKGRVVYNIKSYKAGYSTAVKIDHIGKVSSYVSKYITKDMPKFKGKQRYWCSNGLKRPLKIINPLLSDEDRKLFESSFEDKQKYILEYVGKLPDKDIARIADYGRLREDDLWVKPW